MTTKRVLWRWGARVGLVLLLALGAWPAPVRAVSVGDAWEWPLPPRRFSGLSQDERVMYSKAEDLFRKGSYEAAAIEFEKFIAQYPKSGANSHCMLMHGYSLHLANQRNQAITAYQELIDLYGETVPDDAVPAMFLMGNAQIENGNVEKGMGVLKELTDNEKYLQNPLADVALNQEAQHYLNIAKNEKAAETCWLKVNELFTSAFVRPDGAFKEARQNLTALYIRQERYEALEELFAKESADAAKAVERLAYISDLAMAGFDQLKPDGKQAFFRWFTGKRAAFEAGKQLEDYLNRALQAAWRMKDQEEWRKLAKEALAGGPGVAADKRAPLYWHLTERMADASRTDWKVEEEWKAFSAMASKELGALPPAEQVNIYGGMIDRMHFKMTLESAAGQFWNVLVARCQEIYRAMPEGDRDAGLASLVDRLAAIERYERAYIVAGQIGNVPLSRWKTIEVLGRESKFAEEAKACEELEKLDNKELSARAMRTRADLYKDQLARYQDAIKLYNEINDAPATSWAIADCYERDGKPDRAVAMCSEIESFFADIAPVAAFRKAEIWERAGDKAKAIAAARAVLKKYPKHQVSSTAHQMLERYGIATGGGVTDKEE